MFCSTKKWSIGILSGNLITSVIDKRSQTLLEVEIVSLPQEFSFDIEMRNFEK